MVGGSITNLTLYLVHGKTIEPILNYMPIDEFYENTLDSGECPHRSTNVSRTLSAIGTKTNGLSDLRVIESRVTKREKRVENKCNLISAKPKIKRYTLQFDGIGYPLPKEITGQ